jgi:predicted DNA-binding transcriptional regulator YafY
MALTKHALIRYQVLDKCFRNPGRDYTLDDLLEECNKALYDLNGENDGIKRRQLFKDISFMESEQGWSIPLERYRFGDRNQNVFYRYDDLSFSINNQPLNQEETNQLKSALYVLSRFTGTPQFEWVNEMIPIIEDKLGLVGQGEKVIAFDSNIDSVGLQFIQPIFSAITNKLVLKVSYQDFKTDHPYHIIFHPQYLKQFNNRWFVFGFDYDNTNDLRNLALDRVVDLITLKEKYFEAGIDWDDYFYDIIGVTKPKGAELETVVLRFNKEQSPYVRTKPIHPSQKIRTIESGIEVIIKVIINFELERLILSYGERVEVVVPDSLRQRIKGFLQLALKHYY